MSLPGHPRALRVFLVVRARWASGTGDLGARTRCVRCRAWICVPCVVCVELVLNGGGGRWEWATEVSEDSWCPR